MGDSLQSVSGRSDASSIFTNSDPDIYGPTIPFGIFPNAPIGAIKNVGDNERSKLDDESLADSETSSKPSISLEKIEKKSAKKWITAPLQDYFDNVHNLKSKKNDFAANLQKIPLIESKIQSLFPNYEYLEENLERMHNKDTVFDLAPDTVRKDISWLTCLLHEISALNCYDVVTYQEFVKKMLKRYVDYRSPTFLEEKEIRDKCEIYLKCTIVLFMATFEHFRYGKQK